VKKGVVVLVEEET